MSPVAIYRAPHTSEDVSKRQDWMQTVLRIFHLKADKMRQLYQQLEKQLVKLQSLNEQLVKMRKRMFGQSSEQIQYVDCLLYTSRCV